MAVREARRPKKPAVAATPFALGPELTKQIAEARPRLRPHLAGALLRRFRPLAEDIPAGEVAVFRGRRW